MSAISGSLSLSYTKVAAPSTKADVDKSYIDKGLCQHGEIKHFVSILGRKPNKDFKCKLCELDLQERQVALQRSKLELDKLEAELEALKSKQVP